MVENTEKNVNILTPKAVREYNQGMGETDRMDQNINAYRVSIRGKKWWWSIFTWFLDASLQNAWLLRQLRDEISQKNFKRQVAMTYLKSYQNKSKGRDRKSANMPGPENARYYHTGLLVIPIPDNKREGAWVKLALQL